MTRINKKKCVCVGVRACVCVTLVHQSEFTASCHKNRIEVRYGACCHDVAAHSLETQKHHHSTTEYAHNHLKYPDTRELKGADNILTVCATCRDVANLQPGEPAQLLQDGEEDFSLVRRKSVHRQLQHRPHVAESACCAKHDAYEHPKQTRL